MSNFPCFCCPLLTFFKINIFKILFQEHYQSVKPDPYQGRQSVGPDLGPNGLKRLSADDTSFG